MKELLSQYASYTMWADQQLTDAILLLPESTLLKEVPGSFNSLHKTVLHMWDVGSIWWQRLKLQERVIPPSQAFNGNTSEAVKGLLSQDSQWKEWVSAIQEHILLHVFQYQNSKKEQFKQPTYQVVLQVFNHATYHRGQLVTMLHELDITKIPNTDFIAWARKK